MTSLIKLDVATDVCCTIAEFLGSSKLRGYIIRIHTGHEPCTVQDTKSGNAVAIPADQYIEIDMDSESPTGIGQDQDRFTGSVWHLLPDDRVSIQTDDVEALLVQCREPGFAKVTGSDKWNFPTIYFDANGITRIDNGRGKEVTDTTSNSQGLGDLNKFILCLPNRMESWSFIL